MASAFCDIPVILPGNKITGSDVTFLIVSVVFSNSFWSVAVEPPISIPWTPAFSTFFIVSIVCLLDIPSESINEKQIVHFF